MGDLTDRPGHDLELGVKPLSRAKQCSPTGGSEISIARTGPLLAEGSLIDSH